MVKNLDSRYLAQLHKVFDDGDIVIAGCGVTGRVIVDHD